VDPKDVGPAGQADDGRGQRSLQALFRRNVQNLPDHRLPGHAHHHRPAETGDRFQFPDQGAIVLELFAESDARIDGQALLVQAVGGGDFDLFSQEVPDLGHDVVVARGGLHGFRDALHVHQDESRAGFRGQDQQPGVHLKGADVVDDVRSGLQSRPGRLELGRIDREKDPRLGSQRGNHRNDAPDLLLGRNGIGAGAGAFPPDVDDVGALVGQSQAVVDGPSGIEIAPAVEKGVGRDVENPHHPGPRPQEVRRALDAEDGSGPHFTSRFPAGSGDCPSSSDDGGGEEAGLPKIALISSDDRTSRSRSCLTMASSRSRCSPMIFSARP